MANDTSEIEKLTERIAKDPKSKLFVPLAEEYKKSGDIDMAIQVLNDGLKANPGYVTARSFLGRLLLDRGDIAGAQKEFEEVIKAIPDNLLAQRKLGDIYVLQGRGGDAQQRYKAALALNPADKELPSLISDLAAGKDVSARVPRPKTAAPASASQSAPPPAQQKPAPAAAAKPAVSPPVSPAAAQKTVPAAPLTPKVEIPRVAAAASKAEAAPVAPKKEAAPASLPPKTETVPAAPVAPKIEAAPASSPPKTEAAPAAPALLKTDPAPAAPITQKTEEAPAAAAEAIAPSRPAEQEVPALDEAEVIEDIVEIEHLEKPAADTSIPAFDVPLTPEAAATAAFEAPAFDLADQSLAPSTDAGGLTDITWGSDTFSVPPIAAVEESAAVPEEGGDDLNTNTLAELYISQGFYDKAIEIYQGMLGERPDNKQLQEKIEKLRGLAGIAEQNAAGAPLAAPSPQEAVPAEIPAVAEPLPAVEAPFSAPAEVPVQETISAKPEVPASAEVPGQAISAQPEGPAAGEVAFAKVVRESEQEGQEGRGPRASTQRRKKTIDRLESWLTNILKEKK